MLPGPKRLSGWWRPVLGQEIVEAGGGVRADPTQDVGQVGERILAVGRAGRDEGIEVGEVLAGLLGLIRLFGHQTKNGYDGEGTKAAA